jgi:5'-methylthioadenosine phosphorylase
MDIIGMTNMVEARLAREAEICYATLAAVTDYDCWHQTESTVTVDVILDNLKRNVDNAKRILKGVISQISNQRDCSCAQALKYAIVTDPKAIPQEVKEKLDIIIRKYIQ